MLKILELDFDYEDIPLFRGINIQVPCAGLLHLKGSNGAGKTTLLKLIAGIYVPSGGEIQFEGQAIAKNLDSYHQHLCYLGHKIGISSYLTLKENCSFDLHYDLNQNDFLGAVELLHLTHLLHMPCGQLSAGQRRKAALLRLWMSRAKLWLLDEPFTSLDAETCALVMQKIEQHRSAGGAVILTSHQDLPLACADYQEYVL